MKYYVEFPPNAGQFAGVHTFFSTKARAEFITRAERNGAAGSEQWDDKMIKEWKKSARTNTKGEKT